MAPRSVTRCKPLHQCWKAGSYNIKRSMKIGDRILENMLQELDGIIVVKTGSREACTPEAMSPIDIHGVLCAMAEHMRSTIRIGVLVETIYPERTARLPSARCLVKVLARYLCHAGFIGINRLFLSRATIRKEMRRRRDETRWCATEGTTLDHARKDDIG